MAPEQSPIELDVMAPEVVPGIRVMPVVHGRVEMAALVRTVLNALRPAGVAVELPTTMAEPVDRAVARLPKISLVVADEPDDEAIVWVVAPGDPFAEALRWARDRDAASFCVDPDIKYAERHSDPVPDPYIIWELGGSDSTELLRDHTSGVSTAADKRRESGMAFHAVRAQQSLGGGQLLVLVGAAHANGLTDALQAPTVQPLARTSRATILLRHLHPESLSGILMDAPVIHAAFEHLRENTCPYPRVSLADTIPRKVAVERHGLRLVTNMTADDQDARRHRLVSYLAQESMRALSDDTHAPDRKRLGAAIWRVARDAYAEQTMHAVRGWQTRMFFDFARRYTRTQGGLVPGMYEWVVAARGVGDDNLAWEVFDVARNYPWQDENAELPTVRIDGADLDLGTRRIRFRRRFFKVKQRLVGMDHRRRRSDEDPEEWLQGFDSGHICSYPPEDLVIEDYGRYLQQRAVSVLNSENLRTEPFSTSLLDGVDIRETLRNLHEQRIYVREERRSPGEAGAVVVIFDPDPDDSSFPYHVTWLGEHENESDMAFYATDPTQQVVGPGIMRATYGGFMMSLPPGRLFDIWRDPDYRKARTKAEVLMMAAVDYSEQKIVVHVGETPPPHRLREYGARQGKKIVHIPLGTLSPTTLKKIRVVHVLAGADKRALVKDYIW